MSIIFKNFFKFLIYTTIRINKGFSGHINHYASLGVSNFGVILDILLYPILSLDTKKQSYIKA